MRLRISTVQRITYTAHCLQQQRDDHLQVQSQHTTLASRSPPANLCNISAKMTSQKHLSRHGISHSHRHYLVQSRLFKLWRKINQSLSDAKSIEHVFSQIGSPKCRNIHVPIRRQRFAALKRKSIEMTELSGILNGYGKCNIIHFSCKNPGANVRRHSSDGKI